MREAMARAVVGDDGYGEDPDRSTRLEARYAELVGKEAAVFVPSGVMANQIAVRVLAQPGDLVMAGAHQHVVGFEMGAASRNAAIQFVDGRRHERYAGARDVLEAIIDSEKDHQPHVALVCVENTHMASGGVPWDVEDLRSTRERRSETGPSTSTARDSSTRSLRPAPPPRRRGARHHGDVVSLEGSLRAGGITARGSGGADGTIEQSSASVSVARCVRPVSRRRRSRGPRHHGGSLEGRPRARASTG